MKGQGTRAKQHCRPAPPLLEELGKAVEFRPQTLAEWCSCHQTLMTPSTLPKAAVPKGSPALILNGGESLQAPKSLEFGGIFEGQERKSHRMSEQHYEYP